jgi:thiol-disulfide isomerase/thioredoxin
MRTKIRAALGAVVACVAGVSLLTACTGTNAVDQGTGAYRFVSANSSGSLIAAKDRHKVGVVSGSLLNGGTFTLSQDLGKVTVINFWATWCGPCKTETPQFDSVYRQYKSRGVTFVGVDTKEGDKDAPRAFVKDNNISYPIVFDEIGQTAVELGKIPSQSLPFTVLVDKQGRIAAVYIAKLEPKDLEPVLTKLIAEP